MVERVFPEPQFRTFYPLDDMASRAISSLSLEAAASSNGNGTNTPITSQTITYVPVDKPPTPAPSPRPNSAVLSSVNSTAGDPAHLSRLEFAGLLSAGPTARQQYLASLLRDCTPAELLFVSTTIAPLLKRDFLYELPTELALHILSFVDDPKSLASASLVSRFWNKLVRDEATWKRMCELCRFDVDEGVQEAGDGPDSGNKYAKIWVKMSDVPPGGMPLPSQTKQKSVMPTFSYKRHFEKSFITTNNWRRGGRLLNKHRPPTVTPDGGVVTSVAIDHEWIVVGLASCKIQVFSARTGVLTRTLSGHESGVWAVNLVSRGGRLADAPSIVHTEEADTGNEAVTYFSARAELEMSEMHIPQTLRTAIGLDRPRGPPCPAFDLEASMKPSDICSSSEGWGQANALVVSGGCDKELRVWDVKSGYCIFILRGHTSTIRCLRVLHNRPIAVSGSRDTTLRVWDVQRGRLLRTLTGHDESVRCLDVCGNRVVSGSYDCTCRLWNVDTGECLQVLRGHLHQIYSVAFDGAYIASGGLDTTVRVWRPDTGECLALLQGHTALVCQLQLSGDTLATGGSDGRVITFSLSTMSAMRRIAAHDSSVTALQFDSRFLVTAGNDGRVRLYDAATGAYVRDLTNQAESVWKVAHKKDKCVIMCRRAGKTVMEIWSFRPSEEDD